MVVSACSSGSSATRPGSTTTSTKPTTAAGRIAQAGLLQSSDLPTGYKTSAPGTSDDEAIRSTPACGQFPSLTEHGVATASSPTFFNRETLVGNKVDVFAKSLGPRALIEALRDPAIIGCLHDLVVASLTASKSASTLTSLDVSPIAVDAGGDDSASFRFTAVTTTNGTPRTTLQDQVVVRVGRSILGARAEVVEPGAGEVRPRA